MVGAILKLYNPYPKKLALLVTSGTHPRADWGQFAPPALPHLPHFVPNRSKVLPMEKNRGQKRSKRIPILMLRNLACLPYDPLF